MVVRVRFPLRVRTTPLSKTTERGFCRGICPIAPLPQNTFTALPRSTAKATDRKKVGNNVSDLDAIEWLCRHSSFHS